MLSFEQLQTRLKNISVSKGSVELSTLNFKGPFHHPDQWHYEMTGKMQNLVLFSDAFGEPVTVNKGSFEMTSGITAEVALNRVQVKQADLTWGKNNLILLGEMIFSKNDTLLDLTVTADAIDWHQVDNIIDYVENAKEVRHKREEAKDLLGSIKVQAESFNYENYSVHPLKAEL